MNKEPIEDQIKQSMDAITDAIDISTQVKLNEARHAALNQPKSSLLKTFSWSFAGMAAAVFLAFTILVNGPEQLPTNAPDVVLFEDLELLANEADTEFYQDLEFLTWLDEGNWQESDI